MHKTSLDMAFALAALLLLWNDPAVAANDSNLIEDSSFEESQEPNQFGHVFTKWGGWKYEGDCSFAVGQVAHSGKTSGLLRGATAPKIRLTAADRELEPGRYRITAWIRGLDIGTGTYNATTEFMFNEKYMQLQKNGTFGWTQLTYVADLPQKKKVIGPSFGLMAPGFFWIDDVILEKVGADVALTAAPVLGKEQAPIAPPGKLGAGEVRCGECGYRNLPAWNKCYACGTQLTASEKKATGPAVKLITSFEEEKNAFSEGGVIVAEHATDGTHALRIDVNWASMSEPQNWLGYDFLKADVYTDAKDPVSLGIEIRDAQTDGYWTRVNYNTIIPPGASTLVIPVKQLYVGEKSRPGRMLLLGQITRFVFIIGDKPQAPVFIDNLRLERDDEPKEAIFDGLVAYDLGPAKGPVMEGFTQITPATIYTPGRGFGLKDAQVWRPDMTDVLQPDPLYQDFLAIERGGIAIDVPNGKYKVFVNIDMAGGFWGEVARYKNRKVLAEGQEVVNESLDFEGFRKKYFRFWDSDDLPTENTFDKFQKRIFSEKTFEVDVKDGQLNVDFEGSDWTCAVSCFIAYPTTKAAEGEKFLKFVENRRRFHFDNYFKRILHRPTGDPLAPTEADKKRGYVAYDRDFMRDLYYNDTPLKSELGHPLTAHAFAGEMEPLSLCLLPLRDLGTVTVSASDLDGTAGKIPSSAVSINYVSYRISRVTMEGSVYTIGPRLLMPANTIGMPKDVARRFLLTVTTPANTKPGVYKGVAKVQPEQGQAANIPIEFTVHSGPLDALDVPAGPWGFHIGVPWFEDDPAAAAYREAAGLASLKKMREYGFTTFSGGPRVDYKGFQGGKPLLDFTGADALMRVAKELGFLAVNSYGAGVAGINAYERDIAKMNEAGFQDYAEFLKAVYTEVQRHADEADWLPVYWNLGDEPLGDALVQSAENAEAYRQAFSNGPPFFTAATSFEGQDPNDPHFRLSKALHLPTWNLHSVDGIRLLQQQGGGDWAFYNGGNRWTFGDYMYKAAKQFNMKYRITWHWNAVAGDPYYALDCREDDYAWCNSAPDGTLIPSLDFEQTREGVDDYRRLLTLARLCKEKKGAAAAEAGEKLIAERLAAFKLGQRDHDPLFGFDDWNAFRAKVNAAIDALRN